MQNPWIWGVNCVYPYIFSGTSGGIETVLLLGSVFSLSYATLMTYGLLQEIFFPKLNVTSGSGYVREKQRCKKVSFPFTF